jgi:hypothetical protein
MSPELQAFYNAYATWLNNGAVETYISHVNPWLVTSTFARSMGLCTNLNRYTDANHIPDAHVIEAELFDQLERESYPFGGSTLYNAEARGGRSYLNAQRRAWVHKHSEIPVRGEV